MNKAEAQRHFEEYRKYLVEELGRLASYVRLYRRLHERRADRFNEMNIAPAFFVTTIDALFSAICFGLISFLVNVQNAGW